jgi:hypothetical protein
VLNGTAEESANWTTRSERMTAISRRRAYIGQCIDEATQACGGLPGFARCGQEDHEGMRMLGEVEMDPSMRRTRERK